MTPIDEPVTLADLAATVMDTFHAHHCRPGQVRQRRCPHCTDTSCGQLAWAQEYTRQLGRGIGWGVR